MKIAVTGHRPNKLGNEYSLKGKYSDYIRLQLSYVIEHHKPTTLISGMALGVDQIWALLAIELNLNLIAAIPCLNQQKMWTKPSKDLYQSILEYKNITIIQVYDKEYNHKCMQERNIWMVNNCDKLIGVWDGSSGGTKNCLDYAKSINKETIIIDPNP